MNKLFKVKGNLFDFNLHDKLGIDGLIVHVCNGFTGIL